VLSIVIVLLTAIVAQAQQPSQPPTPSRGEGKRDPQTEQAQPTNDKTTTAQRGTEADPLYVRETRSEAQSSEDRQDREDEQANRRYALWLSIVTTVVLGFQVWLLLRQNDIIRKQNAIMKKQRNAADKQSEYMRDGLSEATKTADAAKESAHTAALALTLAHRPYFDVNDLRVIDNLYDAWPAEDSRQPPPELSISYRVFNASPAPATITFIGASYHVRGFKDDFSYDSAGEDVRTVISPNRGYRYPVMEWTGMSAELFDAYRSKTGLTVDVEYRLKFLDAFDREHSQTIKRIVHCSIGAYRSFLTDHTPADETTDKN
jgi:hypothetical protein